MFTARRGRWGTADIASNILALAVKHLGRGYKDVSLVLAQADQAMPQLRQAYAEAQTPSEKLVYAHVLGILGDPAGVETLAAVVAGDLPGLRLDLKDEAAFGRRMSEEDSYIVALGRTRDKRALAPLLKAVRALDARSTFSRFRAVTLALEALGDPAAEELFVLAAKAGIQNIKVLIAPIDFRSRPVSDVKAEKPLWLKPLYERLKKEMASYTFQAKR